MNSEVSSINVLLSLCVCMYSFIHQSTVGTSKTYVQTPLVLSNLKFKFLLNLIFYEYKLQ